MRKETLKNLIAKYPTNTTKRVGTWLINDRNLTFKYFSFTGFNPLCLSGLVYFHHRIPMKPVRPNWCVIDVGSVNYMAGFYARNHILGFSPLIYLHLTVGHKAVSDRSAESQSRVLQLRRYPELVWASWAVQSMRGGKTRAVRWIAWLFLPALLALSLQLLTGAAAHLLSLNACVASTVTKGLIASWQSIRWGFTHSQFR